MDLLSTQPFWPIRDGLPANYPRLADDLRCEVAVIGAGISGALTGWALTAADIPTVILDARDVAHGSTAGSTSLLQYELDEPLHRLIQRYGPAPARQAYQRCHDAIAELARLVGDLKIDCGFSHRSSLFLARNRSHLPRLRREFEARREAGFAVDWWPRRRLARESSLPHPAGILSRTGAQVDAYRLTHGLLAAAQRKGAAIYDRTPVHRVRHRRDAIELTVGAGHRVRARHLVHASGYEADLALPQRLTEWRSTYALITEPVAGFAGWPAERCLIWESADPYVYLRSTADQRIIIGGYDEPFTDPRARDRLLPRKTAALQRRLRQFFPRIDFDVAYSWAGTFARTADGLPCIGAHPRVPRTWFALGYGGNGITFSYLAAELIRDGVLGRPHADGALFGFGRLGSP